MKLPGAGWRLSLFSGCGFALALGWLWFPFLRQVLLPGGLPDPDAARVFRPILFGLALGAGCIGYGLAAGRLGRAARWSGPLVHVAALLLLALAGLAPKIAGVADLPADIFAGLATGLAGVWWTARLLSHGPAQAVAALAWAGAASLLLAWLAAPFPAGIASSFIFPAAFLVPAGLAALFTDSRSSRDRRVEPAPKPKNKLPGRAWFRPLGGLAALFFGLGSLNVIVPAPGGAGSGLAILGGLALAAGIFSRPPTARSPRADASGICALAALALCLPFVHRFTPVAADAIFSAGSGLIQGYGLALCAAALGRPADKGSAARRSKPMAELMAGLFLALTLAAANGGYLAGLALTALPGRAGAIGPSLAALAAALAAAGLFRRRPAGLSPALAGQLTEKERALALLLAQGHSNKELAEALELTENTVRWYIKKLNRKTGAAGREELIAALGRE